ncbi:hypothetical protein SAMN05444004_11179 [Jannaschia faecimaris]|uniref:Lipoprotein n=1 Tax=Jannaschia faecimaris TaxID=1244108 RepID=A0A1H3SC63_9RHOB|nr:hypothetical protein [Jannaschia faecimaris]SDZ35592.1 hypothetical protein SAMN05444004_11179 [Jannaschia faecimaris]
MFARITAVLAVTALAGCGIGQSRLNPMNWFGSDREERIDQARAEPSRPVVQEVVSLKAEPTPGGVIISAVGLPPTQGFWEAELVRIASDDPAVLVLDFNILPPLTPEPVGTQPSREVLAGAFFTTQDLTGVRTIAVQGLSNRRSVSRQ